jgi:hypothetical protein
MPRLASLIIEEFLLVAHAFACRVSFRHTQNPQAKAGATKTRSPFLNFMLGQEHLTPNFFLFSD